MDALRMGLQHRLNPLHVYCRLRELGIGNASAQRLSVWWERFVYRFVFA